MWPTAREGFTYTGGGSPLSKSSQDVPRPTPEAEPKLRSSSLDSSIPSGAQARTESEQASRVPAVLSIEAPCTALIGQDTRHGPKTCKSGRCDSLILRGGASEHHHLFLTAM